MTQHSRAIEILSRAAGRETMVRLERILSQRTRHVTVVLEDLYDSQNAGTIVRTAECLGLQEIHVVIGRHPFRPKPQVVRGAARWIELHKHVSADGEGSIPCLRQLRERGYRIVGTTLRRTADVISLADLPVERPVALCFGLEQTGLSDAAHAYADTLVQIPMRGFTQSLNVASSAAICLHDVLQRVRVAGTGWQLEAADAAAVMLQWLMQTVKHADRLLDN